MHGAHPHVLFLSVPAPAEPKIIVSSSMNPSRSFDYAPGRRPARGHGELRPLTYSPTRRSRHDQNLEGNRITPLTMIYRRKLPGGTVLTGLHMAGTY